MKIGVLKEIKIRENRVSMTPGGVETLVANGHKMFVETTAGMGSGFTDKEYVNAGATILPSAEVVYATCDMIRKVKEPLPQEFDLIREDQILFTYFHFAADGTLTRALRDSGAVSIAYETVEKADGSLPLLTPMSEVAGRMSVQEGAKYLEKTYGGKGVLLGGVPGVMPGSVMIIGGGVVGTQAAKMACGLGARVYLLDMSPERLRYLSDMMPPNCFTLKSSPDVIRSLLPEVDLVIGAVLIPGAKAPKLITRDMLGLMEPGSVIVDVAIDQGGCFETSKATTHDNPIYEVDGIIHYCVANMPGAVSQTSTAALSNATLPYAIEIANKGYLEAARQNPEIAKGINIINGQITYKGVADAFGMDYTPIETFL